MFLFAVNGPVVCSKFADLCSPCAKKVPLLCVPSIFLKQLKEQKTKKRGTVFEKEIFARIASLKIQI